MRKILIICFLGVFLILLESCGRLNFDSYFNKTVEIEAKENNYSAYATGAIISNDGLIITNKHVVAGKNNILINYYDAPDIKYQAKILNVSKQYDLALIKIEESKDYFKKIDERCSLGQEIYSIGNAKGYGLSLGKGIITSNYKNIIYNKEEMLSV